MKAFCITILGLQSSVDQAQNCIESGLRIGLEVTLFPATHRFEAVDVAVENRLNQTGFDYVHWNRKRPLRDAQLGCFLSHFRLWSKCSFLDEPIIVFEHDAVVKEYIPSFDPTANEVVNLQDSPWSDPAWPYHRAVSTLREPARSVGLKERGLLPCAYVCLPGTCAYWISPAASRRLIARALSDGPLPADIFVNKSLVNIKDYIPFPVVGEHVTSTVAPNANWQTFDSSFVAKGQMNP